MLLGGLILFCLYVISSASANCLDGRTWTESFAPEPNPVWAYTNDKSPVVWATLDPDEYYKCATSEFQSPINLDNRIGNASNPVINWPHSLNGTLVYKNYAIEVEHLIGDFVPTTIYGDREYRLVQFHFHTPSEHRFEEEYFVLEMHLVHQNTGKPPLNILYSQI